jgi:hypothetical protein
MVRIGRRGAIRFAIAPYALEAIACGCPLIITDLAGQLSAGLSGQLPLADNTRIAEYDWANVARRYTTTHRKVLRRAVNAPKETK